MDEQKRELYLEDEAGKLHELKIYALDGEEDKRLVHGWASVSTVAGKQVTDSKGNQIPTHVLRPAAHNFMLESREARSDHDVIRAGDVVESFVFDELSKKAYGITLVNDIEGWAVVLFIRDDAVWASVKAGQYPALSIGAEAYGEFLDDDD